MHVHRFQLADLGGEADGHEHGVEFAGIVRIFGKCIPHHERHTDVGRMLDDLLNGDATDKATGVGVFIGVAPFSHMEGVFPSVVLASGIAMQLLQIGQQRGEFEGGTGLRRFCHHGIVAGLEIYRVIAIHKAGEVRHRLDIARGRLHHHGASPFRLGFQRLLQQFLMDNLLDFRADGRINGAPVHRRVFRLQRNGYSIDIQTFLLSRNTCEHFVELRVTVDAVALGHVAKDTLCQLSVGVDTHQKFSTPFVQDVGEIEFFQFLGLHLFRREPVAGTDCRRGVDGTGEERQGFDKSQIFG